MVATRPSVDIFDVGVLSSLYEARLVYGLR